MRFLKYKLYRLKWKLSKYKVPKYPIHVDFELSSKCQLKCSFCPQSEKEQNFPKQFMDYDLYKKVIDEIQGKVKSIKFNLRGESTLHPDFDKFLRYAENKFIDIRINTNGQYRNNIISYYLARFCTDISFSVDAFYENTYKQIRRGGNFELLNRNIEDVIKFCKKYKKKPRLTLSYVVTKKNKEELELFKRYWNKHYKKIKLFIRPVMARVNGVGEEYTRLGNRIIIGRKNCYMPNKRLVVAANGDVYPCCVMWHKPFLKLGTIYSGVKLLDLWNCEAIEHLRWDLKNNDFHFEACKKCESSESFIWK